MAETGKSSSVDLSSCKATMWGFAARSHRSRFGRRRLILLMLKVAIFMPDKLSGRSRSGRLSSATFVDPRIARAEAGQHFVTDGAEMVREFVDRDALANQRHHLAAPHGVLFKIRDVDGHQVHRDAARNRAALAGDHHLGTARAVVTAGGAEISVGIARGDDREFCGPPRGPRSALTHAFAARDTAP